jgi:hypothetical protein
LVRESADARALAFFAVVGSLRKGRFPWRSIWAFRRVPGEVRGAFLGLFGMREGLG